MEVGAGFGAMIMLWMFFAGCAIAATIFWVWVLLDCISNEPSEGNDRIMWVLVIVLLHLLGALVYYFARKPQRVQRYGK